MATDVMPLLEEAFSAAQLAVVHSTKARETKAAVFAARETD